MLEVDLVPLERSPRGASSIDLDGDLQLPARAARDGKEIGKNLGRTIA